MSEASSGGPHERTVGRLRRRAMAIDEWSRGYYCAVAILLRESGCVTPEVRSLYRQGSRPQHAHPDDTALFEEHGLTPNTEGKRPAQGTDAGPV